MKWMNGFHGWVWLMPRNSFNEISVLNVWIGFCFFHFRICRQIQKTNFSWLRIQFWWSHEIVDTLIWIFDSVWMFTKQYTRNSHCILPIQLNSWLKDFLEIHSLTINLRGYRFSARVTSAPRYEAHPCRGSFNSAYWIQLT